MGYRALLKNYIRHLKAITGDHFINAPGASEVLGKRDVSELRLLAAEVEREDARPSHSPRRGTRN